MAAACLTWARPRARLAAVALALTSVLVACGGGGGDGGGDVAEAPPVDPVLAGAPGYGSTELPAGAQRLTLQEFKAWAAAREYNFVTSAELAARVAAQAIADADDERRVAAALAADPSLATAATLGAPGPHVRDLGGQRLVTLDNGKTFALDGQATLRKGLAESLQFTNERSNVEAVIATLLELLPEDQRADFPGAAAPASLDDAALQSLRNQLALRAASLQPSAEIPAIPFTADATPTEVPAAGPAFVPAGRARASSALRARALAFDGTAGTTGCRVENDDTMSSRYNWTLKAHITPIRDQAIRGTCTAHGVVGAMETLLKRWQFRDVNFSEQELYAEAKSTWFPSPKAYGDGLGIYSVTSEMVRRGYRVDLESRWPYNPSMQRLADKDLLAYTHSCDGYSGPCSDTNHQYPVACTQVANTTYCAVQRPATVTDPNASHGRIGGTHSLWVAGQPDVSIAAIKALVGAGKPVVLGFAWDGNFGGAAGQDPNVRAAGRIRQFDDRYVADGGHTVLVVGWLDNGSLPPEDRALDSDGYLVVKNSWGCTGDHGHMYLSYGWLARRVNSAAVVSGVTTTAQLPQATLAVSRGVVRSAAELTFTTTSTAAMTRIELYTDQAATPLKVYTPNLVAQLKNAEFPPLYFDILPEGVNHLIAKVFTETGITSTNWVTFIKDTLPPVVSLTASATTVQAPGSVVLTAAATDATGIAKVEFFRGFTRIGTVTAPPYRMTYAFAAGDLGTSPYVALATDNAGQIRLSPVVNITSAGVIKPIVASFTATPDVLASGGGTATLSWNVLGAGSVSIDNGVGTQPASGTATVNVAATTTFTLTASNGAGSSSGSASVVVQAVLPPVMLGFSAAPAALPFGGGSTTLSWNIGGPTDAVSISPGVGSVTGLTSKVVNVTTTTTFTLSATNAGGTRTRQVTVEVTGDTVAPAVSLAASPAAVTAAGNVKLTATASDNVGVVRVEFWRGATLLGQVAAAPFALDVPLTVADNGSIAFTAKAFDAAGNSALSAAATVAVAIPLPDATPPTVSLASSSQNVTAPGGATLTASATDNVAVTKVEFYEGTTLLAAKTSAPFTLDVSYTAAAVGSHGYTAKAYDAANNVGTSAVVSVQVSLPSSADRYVSNATGSDANDGLSALTAYKTVTKALSTVGANGTVWLANGVYPPENAGIANPGYKAEVPAGITVRAVSDGGASLGFGLSFANGGAAIGLVFNGPTARSAVTGIDASGGTVNLSRLVFTNLGSAIAGAGGFGAAAAVKAHGTAVVVLDPGPGNPVTVGDGVENSVLAYEGGKLTVLGGLVQTTGGCGSDACGQVKVGNTAEVVFDGTKFALDNSGEVSPQPIFLLFNSGKVTVRSATLSQAGAKANHHGLVIVTDQSQFTIQDSVMTGTWRYLSAVSTNGGTPTVKASNLQFQGNVTNGLFTANAGTPTIVIDNGTQISNLTSTNNPGIAVIQMTTGGTLRLDGAKFYFNRLVANLSGTSTYDVLVRNSFFAGNAACAQPTCYTFSLAGGAGSVFDFGTAASPGMNTFSADTLGTSLLVKTSAGVTVNAEVNTWVPSVQGTNTLGTYVLGTAPCAATTCNVTTGSGRNFVVQSGAIKLAGS